jgi:apolipoprotein D and lipocalin family protein
MKKLTVLMSFLLFSCSATPSRPVKAVDFVDISRFMGKWYVIANIPTFIEKGAHNAVETYTWNSKEDRIDVKFEFKKDSFEGDKKIYYQKAFIHNKTTNSEWRIQMFWPLKFPYLVMDLAEDYSYTVIGVPNRSYIWIMAKTPNLPDETYQTILKRIKEQDYDLSLIQKVPQKW